jgi:RNA polymerase sigma-70 factor (ECF subfamily)
MMSRLSDEEILSRYKDSGNAEYFGELYNRYIPMLYGVGLKYLNDADCAEDAVIHLFESSLPEIARYSIPSFRTWIYSMMKQHCLQILQAEGREITADSGTETMEPDEILNLFGESNSDREKKELLKRCIRQLPVEQRIVIIRFFMEEMSYTDISNTTEYNLKQVRSYIQDGIRNLKIYIEKNNL